MFWHGALLWGLILGALTVPADAATRLGLQVTQEELTIWRARMTSSATINGFTYQSIYQNRIKADADVFVAQSHPGGDGFWVGYTGAGCAPTDQSVSPGGANGALILRAAFTYLLTGTTAYATPVRAELLNQVGQSGTDWTNTSKWCRTSTTSSGGVALEDCPWLLRLLLAYDYLLAGGYGGFSGTEKTTIENWFLAAGQAWRDGQVYGAQQNSHYPGMFDVPQNLSCANCPGPQFGITYFGGFPIYEATAYGWFNQPATAFGFVMAAGILTNNTSLMDSAKAYYTGWMKAGIYDDGAVSDFYRWSDCVQCLGSMWGHTGGAVASLTAIADLYARKTGDTSLFTMTNATQVQGGSGGTVGLNKILVLWAGMANKTVLYYGTTNAAEQNSNFLLTWDSADFAGEGVYWDFASMAANIFYQNTTIRTAMNRNIVGGTTSISCFTAEQLGSCFSGVGGGWWADLPFMYGNLDAGQINPYSLTSGTVPVVLRLIR
jgi:hypothetical protein